MNTGAVTAACAIGAALLGACSDMGFGYGHGEQVAAWTVRSYVSLDARQQQEVVEQLVSWNATWFVPTLAAGEAAAARSPAQARLQRRERMRRRLEAWLGPLSPVQHRLVATWSAGMQPVSEDVYASSTLPAIAVRSVLRVRGDRGALETELRALLLAPDRGWTRAGDPRFTANRLETWRLLVGVATATDAVQRRRLAQKAEAVAADIERLACDLSHSESGARGR